MSRRDEYATATLLTAAAAFGPLLAGCASDQAPTAPGHGTAVEAVAASAAPFGPFPSGTSIFVDVKNATGVENGTKAHPFNTLSEGLRAATNGSVVGLAAGVYAQTFKPLTENYVIQGLRNFKLLGMGASRTTIRGDHSFSLIRFGNGAFGVIQGLTIEQGGHSPNSVGGGIQILGITDSTSLTVRDVILQDNEAVNGAGISVEGRATVRLVNVLIANNRASNGPGAVFLEGANGQVGATITNSTITANTAVFFGGVLTENGARLRMVNSIVSNNSQGQLAVRSGARANVSFSDIGEQLFPGAGNLSSDPKFIDSTARKYHLRANSPALDAGTSSGAPIRDLFGRTRPLDGNGDGVAATDMGALESIAVQ